MLLSALRVTGSLVTVRYKDTARVVYEGQRNGQCRKLLLNEVWSQGTSPRWPQLLTIAPGTGRKLGCSVSDGLMPPQLSQRPCKGSSAPECRDAATSEELRELQTGPILSVSLPLRTSLQAAWGHEGHSPGVGRLWDMVLKKSQTWPFVGGKREPTESETLLASCSK